MGAARHLPKLPSTARPSLGCMYVSIPCRIIRSYREILGGGGWVLGVEGPCARGEVPMAQVNNCYGYWLPLKQLVQFVVWFEVVRKEVFFFKKKTPPVSRLLFSLVSIHTTAVLEAIRSNGKVQSRVTA